MWHERPSPKRARTGLTSNLPDHVIKINPLLAYDCSECYANSSVPHNITATLVCVLVICRKVRRPSVITTTSESEQPSSMVSAG